MSINTFEQMIFEGSLKETSRFSESDIAEKIVEGMPSSRTIVREGLNTLANLGLVEQLPKVGTKVTLFNEEEKDVMMGTRSDMEGRAVGKLIVSIEGQTEEEKKNTLSRLYDQINIMHENTEKGDYVGVFKADLDFHTTISLIANLPTPAEWIRFFFLIGFLSTHSRLIFSKDTSKMIKVEGKRITAEHEGIYEAIITGDKKCSGRYVAEDRIRDHIYKAEKHWIKALDRLTP